MKKITKIFYMIAALALILGPAESCQEFVIDSQKEFPDTMKIDAQPEYQIVATSPKNIVFNINSNVPWEIKSSESWCIPTPSMSATSSLVAEISVKCESNNEYKPREAVLTISGEGIEAPVKVTVRQGPKGILEVQPVDKKFTVEGGTATFTITSNQEWRAVSRHQWLTFDKPSGDGTGEIEIITAKCARNAGAMRSTIVTVSNGIETKTFEVDQDGSYLRFKPVEDESVFAFAGEGAVKLFEVETDLENWEPVSANPDYASVRKTDDGKVEVKMGFNPIFMDRKVSVTLNPIGEDVPGLTGNTIELTQAKNFNPIVTGTSKITVDPETGAATLDSPNAEQCRFSTIGKKYQLGKYTWTFSDVQVEQGYWIDANFFCKGNPPHWNLYLGTNNAEISSKATFALKTWAKGVTGFHSGVFAFDPISVEEVNKLRKLEVELKPTSSAKTDITVKVIMNDTKVLVDQTLKNPFAKSDYKNDGTQIYFGFFGGGKHTKGKMTITSFDIVKY